MIKLADKIMAEIKVAHARGPGVIVVTPGDPRFIAPGVQRAPIRSGTWVQPDRHLIAWSVIERVLAAEAAAMPSTREPEA